jgi:predicted 2-oxoglutarate/Fe(II)-dependent dioxygenase YbiX
MFPAVEGELLLFKSDLRHRVVPVQHDGVRVSIAFNTWITGEIGDDLSVLTL